MGRPIGVCGESAGDPLLALVLAGLGVSSLSMAPSKVPVVRLALSLHSLPECQGLATVAREARTAREALEAVRSRARRGAHRPALTAPARRIPGSSAEVAAGATTSAPDSLRTRTVQASRGEGHGDVAAALPGEPLAHLHQHRHRREPAGQQRLALHEPVGRPQHRLGREPEGPAQLGDVVGAVHPHQHQVVALAEDLRVDLRGALRREQQPQPVLAALGGDLDEPVEQPLRHRAGRLGAAQVVGLVDDEQGRHPTVALGPQLVDDLEADRDRLGRVAEPAEVHHRDAVAGR